MLDSTHYWYSFHRKSRPPLDLWLRLARGGCGARVKIINVGVLRTLFRGLLAFRSVYEGYGQDSFYDPSTGEWSLWDLEYLFEQSQTRLLAPRQSQAIDLCLVQNLKESDAAIRMGIKATNPVSSYSNTGLRTLVLSIETGMLSRFRPDDLMVA